MRSLLLLLTSLIITSLPLLGVAQEPSEATPERRVETVEEGTPRYLAAMQSELEALRVPGMSCEAEDSERARCTFTLRGVTTGREFSAQAFYSDRTDTIYLHIERFIAAPADAATTPTVLRRLMELNWTLLLGKLEWNATDGEVRLAIVLNTDSNFDRRAFRSAVRALGQLADRYVGELERVARGRD